MIKNPFSEELYKKRTHPQTPDFRGEYFRDQTKIIHSQPFRRLKSKTQVFAAPENDHICTRIEHVMHVATIAVSICKGLKNALEKYFHLNVDDVLSDNGLLRLLIINNKEHDEGKIYDVVAGSFLVVGLTEDGFDSLTPEQIEKYEKHFHQPEVFVRMGKGIMALPIPDEAIEARQEKTWEMNRQELKEEMPVRNDHRKVKEEAR